jgi:hypothetical protein
MSNLLKTEDLIPHSTISIEDVRKLVEKLNNLRQLNTELVDALEALIPLAEFGASEQSPPYAQDYLIETALAAIAKAKEQS